MTVKWGIVSTIKAPLAEIQRFAAWHLEHGAHRLFLYLDDADPEKAERLNSHPKLRVILCDETYWKKRGNRPERHQPRQTMNAAHALSRAKDVDWLLHCDVDEFLWPGPRSVGSRLASLPATCLCARVRPWEALSGENGRYFKGVALSARERRTETEAFHPQFGQWLNGGFLSHVAGKLFLRTGHPELKPRIHNVYAGEVENPGQQELTDLPLLHFHAKSREDFLAAYRFRLTEGSYRSELKPNRKREDGGLSMHELLSMIEAEHGEAGLREFYDEVCLARPALLEALRTHGRLLEASIDAGALIQRHFA